MTFIWRHPPPRGASERCIGHTDLPVDRRKAKRLAHRIRRVVRREGGPREVWTSPLRRCADVGRWLRRWGWRHRIDARLSELYFGAWDGRRWEDISAAQVEAWCADFAHHGPGGGESVAALLARCEAVAAEWAARGVCLVAHAGWINALRWLCHDGVDEGQGGVRWPAAHEWPMPVAYGARAPLTPDARRLTARCAAPSGPSRNSG